METKFNFNSQVATSREQSERLLALGLKKETADFPVWGTENLLYMGWSLHRLWELYWSNKVVSDCLFGCGKYMSPYAKMIAMIEYDIEDGTFNKEYLV